MILSFKKLFNIILKNILIFIALFITLELICFNVEKQKYINVAKKSNGFFNINSVKYSFHTNDFEIIEGRFRPIETFGKKHSMLFFGCSFNYGANLQDNQILSYKLAKLTKSTAYNRASSGWGAQQMLYQLRGKEIYSIIKDEPDYIVYVYMSDHINRLNKYQWGMPWDNQVNLRYREKNGKLIEQKPFLKSLWHCFTIKALQVEYEKHLNSPKDFTKNLDLFRRIMKESLTLLKGHYPKTKFIILIYSPCFDNTPQENKMFSDLEKDGFIVLRTQDIVTEDLRQPQYHFGSDCHPTEQAWDAVAPALIKKLKL